MPPLVVEARGSSAHLILNPAAGRGAAFLGRLTGAARERGIRVRVLEAGEDARLAALEAAEDGAGTLGVAGGDGSVTAVAGVAVERELPLVVVPTGTLNHFARDLGLDLARPLRALDAFDAGHERRVDVGRINGRAFINNVSLGVYADMLGDPRYRREKLRVAQAKLQTAVFDLELRRSLRITPPGGRRSRASSPWSSRTTPTSSRLSPRWANVTAWTPGHCRSPCSTPARSTSSNACSRARCSAPSSSVRDCATGSQSIWRWASLARPCGPG